MLLTERMEQDLSEFSLTVKHSVLSDKLQEVMLKRPVLFQEALKQHIINIAKRLSINQEQRETREQPGKKLFELLQTLEPHHLWIKLKLDKHDTSTVKSFVTDRTHNKHRLVKIGGLYEETNQGIVFTRQDFHCVCSKQMSIDLDCWMSQTMKVNWNLHSNKCNVCPPQSVPGKPGLHKSNISIGHNSDIKHVTLEPLRPAGLGRTGHNHHGLMNPRDVIYGKLSRHYLTAYLLW